MMDQIIGVADSSDLPHLPEDVDHRYAVQVAATMSLPIIHTAFQGMAK